MPHPNSAATTVACRNWRGALVALLLLPAAARAQQVPPKAEPDLSDLVAPATERPPLVPPPSGAHLIQAPQYIDGGQKGMMRTIYQHLRWPQIGRVVCVEGNVRVTFDVGTDGKVYDARVVRGLYPDFDAEALKAVRSLGTFMPSADATTNPATISLTIPVQFKIR